MPTITTPRIAAGLILAFTGLAAAACSDDAAALTPQEWRTQADAVCTAGNTRAEAAYTAFDEDGSDLEDAEAIARLYVDELLPNIRQQVDELAALDAPAELRGDVDALLAAAREALATAEDLDPAELETATDPFLEVSSRAQALGLATCGDQ